MVISGSQRLADAVAWPAWARNLNQQWADAHDAQHLRGPALPTGRLMLMMRGRFGLETWTTQRLADADVARPLWARNLNQRSDAHDAQPLRGPALATGRLMLMMRGRFGLETWTTQRLADADVARPVWARNLNQRWADAHDAQPLRGPALPTDRLMLMMRGRFGLETWTTQRLAECKCCVACLGSKLKSTVG